MRARIAAISVSVVGAIALACATPAQQAGFTTPAYRPSERCSIVNMPPEGCSTRVVDEFTGTVSLSAFIPLRSPVLEVVSFASIPNGHSPRDRAVEIGVWSRVMNDWRYLECARIDLLADAAPVPLASRPERRGHVGNGYVTERVIAEIASAGLSQIESASRFRGRLCTDVFEFTPAQVLTLRHYLGDYRVELARQNAGGGAPPGADAAEPDAAADGATD